MLVYTYETTKQAGWLQFYEKFSKNFIVKNMDIPVKGLPEWKRHVAGPTGIAWVDAEHQGAMAEIIILIYWSSSVSS